VDGGRQQQQPRSKNTPFWVGPIPTPQLGLKWPLWEPLNGSFMKVLPLTCAGLRCGTAQHPSHRVSLPLAHLGCELKKASDAWRKSVLAGRLGGVCW
jgi:hypothetical protein